MGAGRQEGRRGTEELPSKQRGTGNCPEARRSWPEGSGRQAQSTRSHHTRPWQGKARAGQEEAVTGCFTEGLVRLSSRGQLNGGHTAGACLGRVGSVGGEGVASVCQVEGQGHTEFSLPWQGGGQQREERTGLRAWWVQQWEVAWDFPRDTVPRPSDATGAG